MGLQYRQYHRQPARIPADHGAARRAERGRRHQRLQFDQHRAGALDAGEYRRARCAQIALGEEQFGGVGDFAQAQARHLEHADLIGRTKAVFHRAQDAELLRAFAFERQHRIDHVLDHARAGDLAVLGDVADQDDGGAGFLRKPNERLRGRPHLRHRAGRRFDRVGPHGLDRIDHDQARHRAFGQGRDDVLDGGFGRQLHRRVCKAEPLGAEPHLRDRLLAGDIDGAVAGPRQEACRLRQQCRFADAGIAADEQHRAAHEAAAGDAIKLGHAGGQTRGVVTLARQAFQLEYPALAPGADRDRHRGRAGRIFFRKRIPLAAGLTLALPAVIRRAAVLADKGERGFGHRGLSRPD